MQQLLAWTLISIVGWPFLMSTKPDSFSACLPEHIKLGTIVSVEQEQSPSPNAAKPVTVGQRLNELKARCRKGKLVDGKGREIQFVHLIGCWGNPPEDYMEQLERQRVELKRLKEKYTVVEISCEQGRDPREIH